MEAERDNCDAYSDVPPNLRVAAQVGDQQNDKCQPVKPDRPIEGFEMIVEKFKAELSILRVNGRAEGAETFA